MDTPTAIPIVVPLLEEEVSTGPAAELVLSVVPGDAPPSVVGTVLVVLDAARDEVVVDGMTPIVVRTDGLSNQQNSLLATRHRGISP